MEDKPGIPEGFLKSEFDNAQLKQKIFDETLSSLKTEERFVNYFRDFQESSVNQFMEYYSHMKAEWYSSGTMMTSYRNFQQTQWWKYAFECLGHIQHKKLFNLQCQWRAEKIKLEGFEICYDFTSHRQEILDCKAIPPVSHDELNAYIQYLEELSDEEPFLDQWNIGDDYDRLKSNYYGIGRPDGVYPEWYRFYDKHFGTDILLALPDIRGEKENFYRDLWRKEKEPEWAAHAAARDTRPFIKNLIDREFAEWFLKTFDSKETLALYRSTRLHDDILEQTEHIQMDLINLQQARQRVPIEQDEDWRKGIERACELYHRQKTIALLPAVWELYSQRMKEGKPAMEKEDRRFERDSPSSYDIRSGYLEHILRGRELNGEPRDLNF